MPGLDINKIEELTISPINRFQLSAKNIAELKKNFTNSNILITGAAGSIGSEFTKKLKSFKFNKLYLLDKDENKLTELNRNLVLYFNRKKILSTRYICVDLKFTDLSKFIKENKISHYLNFAAVKHVRSEDELISAKYLFETNSKNFFNNSIKKCKTLKQIFSISTDKVVEPTSFLGISKKVMEDRLFKFKKNNPRFFVSSVRFANVSYSNGSILKYALDRINHKKFFGFPTKIERFFITHDEAINLCMLSLLKISDGYILAPHLDILKNSVTIETIILKLLKLYNYDLTTSKKNHLIANAFYAKKVNSNISGQKLYERLYDNLEKVKFFNNNKLILIEPSELNFDPEIFLRKIAYSNKLSTIKKVIKSKFKKYKIKKNVFKLKDSL